MENELRFSSCEIIRPERAIYPSPTATPWAAYPSPTVTPWDQKKRKHHFRPERAEYHSPTATPWAVYPSPMATPWAMNNEQLTMYFFNPNNNINFLS